ncbi:MAG: hypothetical protein ACXWQ5_00405 [Ktedonobacterales bacterium]
MSVKHIYYHDYEHLGFDTTRELHIARVNEPLRVALATPLTHGATHAVIAFGQRDNDWLQLYVCSVAPTDEPDAEMLWIHLYLNFYMPVHNVFPGDTACFAISADDLDHVLAYKPIGPYECDTAMPWDIP